MEHPYGIPSFMSSAECGRGLGQSFDIHLDGIHSHRQGTVQLTKLIPHLASCPVREPTTGHLIHVGLGLNQYPMRTASPFSILIPKTWNRDVRIKNGF